MNRDHRIIYDQESDTLYVHLTDANVAKSIPLNDEVWVHVDEHGDWVIIEIIGVVDLGELIAGATLPSKP